MEDKWKSMYFDKLNQGRTETVNDRPLWSVVDSDT